MSRSSTVADTTLLGFLQALAHSAASQRHALRSPISVLSGVIEDAQAGIVLEADEIKDAQLALERLTKLVSTLSVPAIPQDLLDEPSCVSSTELATWLESLFDLPCALLAPDNSEGSTIVVPKQILAALVGLELAVMDRLWRAAPDEAAQSKSQLALIVDITTQKLVLELRAPQQIDAIATGERTYEGFESALITLYCALLAAEQIEAHSHRVRYQVPLTT